MAKYVKTEEGYKALNEIEGSVNLTADNYIEIKNNVIRTTFGDAIVAEEGKEKEIYNHKISSMEYLASAGGYTTSSLGGMDFLKFPAQGDIFKVEVQYPNGQIANFNNVVYKNQNFTCSDEIRIVLSTQYQSVEGYGTVVVVASSNLTGGNVRILRKTEGYVTLPKTALNYDDAPTENSDNLLTSGVLYDRIQALNNKIDALTERLNTMTSAE